VLNPWLWTHQSGFVASHLSGDKQFCMMQSMCWRRDLMGLSHANLPDLRLNRSTSWSSIIYQLNLVFIVNERLSEN